MAAAVWKPGTRVEFDRGGRVIVGRVIVDIPTEEPLVVVREEDPHDAHVHDWHVPAAELREA